MEKADERIPFLLSVIAMKAISNNKTESAIPPCLGLLSLGIQV
jgi:hypothetical protein